MIFLALQIAGGVLFAASTIYLTIALVQVMRFRIRSLTPKTPQPVTIMVPCHGVPPRFQECLLSICRQNYPAQIQVVFGLHRHDDPAKPIIEQLMAEMADLDAQLVVDSRQIGSHPKNCNLANMMPAVKHGQIVLVDSDIIADPQFLSTLLATLERPGVGAATCLYKGLPEPNVASQLGAAYVNDWFIPSGLVDLAVHGLGSAYGVAIAIRRQLLDEIGGFEAMASVVSSDFALGNEVRRKGLSIGLAPNVVSTIVAEASLTGLYRHEMRWMRAIRATRPLDHALWICSSALIPLALLSPVWPLWVASCAIASHLLLRSLIQFVSNRHIGLRGFAPHMLILREIANFFLWLGSFLGRNVRWGTHVMKAK